MAYQIALFSTTLSDVQVLVIYCKPFETQCLVQVYTKRDTGERILGKNVTAGVVRIFRHHIFLSRTESQRQSSIFYVGGYTKVRWVRTNSACAFRRCNVQKLNGC